VLNDQAEIGVDVIADQILARQHGGDARKLFGLRGIDLDNARVRMRTVNHARMEHSRQLEIQRIVDAARYPLLRVYHADRLSNRHASFLVSTPATMLNHWVVIPSDCEGSKISPGVYPEL